MNSLEKLLDKNGLVFAFLFVGIIIYVSYFLSKKVTNNNQLKVFVCYV